MSTVPGAGAAGVVTESRRAGNRFLHRELSAIEFNARVLALAQDRSIPLLERAKFLAIFASNMDEFFQVRVAGLKQQPEAGIRTPSADGHTPRVALSAIAAKVVPLAEKHARMFIEDVMLALAAANVMFRELDRKKRRSWLR